MKYICSNCEYEAKYEETFGKCPKCGEVSWWPEDSNQSCLIESKVCYRCNTEITKPKGIAVDCPKCNHNGPWYIVSKPIKGVKYTDNHDIYKESENIPLASHNNTYKGLYSKDTVKNKSSNFSESVNEILQIILGLIIYGIPIITFTLISLWIFSKMISNIN